MNHKKIKVMHFINGLDVGGAERFLAKTLPMFSDDFENVVCSISGGKLEAQLNNNGIKTYSLAKGTKISKTNLLKILFQIIFRFRTVIHKEKPDILVTYLIHADLFGRVFGRMFGVKKIICSPRGLLLQWEFLRFFDRLTAVMVSKYICVSETLRNQLVRKWKFPSSKMEAVPNGINMSSLHAENKRATVLANLGVSSKTALLTYVANLRDQKGHLELIESLNTLKDNGLDFRILFVGADQGMGKAIDNKIREYGLEGYVKPLGLRSDIYDILSVTDIFVFPSLGEGMSNALLEAMAMGCAIVANDIPENAELIHNKSNGLLGDVHQPDQFAKLIESLINNENERARLGSNAKDTITKKYSIPIVVEKLEKIYSSLVK